MRRSRRENRTAIDQLKRYWDDFVRSGPTTSGQTELDPALAATVRRLHARDDAPAADPAFVARLLENLMDSPQIASLPRTAPVDRADGWSGVANGRTAPLPTTWPTLPPGRTRQRALAWVAVAVLLLTLAGGYAAFGLGWPWSSDGRHANIPAPAATPDPATASGVLIDTVLTDQPLDSQYVVIERWTYAIGSKVTEADTLSSNLAILVTEGRLTATVSRPAQLLRGLGTATAQPVAAGVPQPLVAGDTLLVGPHSILKVDQEGKEPAVTVMADVIGPGIIDPKWTGVSFHHFADTNTDFPPGPLRLVLRRVFLAPGESYPAPADGSFQIAGGEDTKEGARSTIASSADGGATNTGDAPASLLVLTLEPVGGSVAGTPTAGSSTP